MVPECVKHKRPSTRAFPALAAGQQVLGLPNAHSVRRSTSGGLTSPHSAGAAGRKAQHAAFLAQYNETCEDWKSQCRYCGAVRTGTLKRLRAPCNCCNKETENARQASQVIKGGFGPLVKVWRMLWH